MREFRRGLRALDIRRLVGNSPVMLEIGSHEGTDTVQFVAAMPEITLYCFEPDQRPIGRSRPLIGDDLRVTLIEKMVADVDGEKSFWASTGPAGHMEDWDFSGSPSEPTGHYERSPEIRFKPPVMMPSIRLDTWMQDTLPPGAIIDFVWADVQGGQRAMIAGAQAALMAIEYLYIECHHPFPLYEDEPNRKELMALLPGLEPLAFYETDNILFKNRTLR